MRERGLTAGVGWTVPQGCDPRQAREEACDKLKRSGRDLAAQLVADRDVGERAARGDVLGRGQEALSAYMFIAPYLLVTTVFGFIW